MSAFIAIVRRDLLLAARRKSEVFTALFFFMIVVSLFPLGIGPETALLRRIASGTAQRTGADSQLPAVAHQHPAGGGDIR